MAAARSTSFSLPLMPNEKRNRWSSLNKSLNDDNPETQACKKLPSLKMTKVLRKIGAGDRSRQMYVPS